MNYIYGSWFPKSGYEMIVLKSKCTMVESTQAPRPGDICIPIK